jgi:fructose-1,6-bisphosphatase/inositol monophosphatase family enzyme
MIQWLLLPGRIIDGTLIDPNHFGSTKEKSRSAKSDDVRRIRRHGSTAIESLLAAAPAGEEM